MRSWGSLAVVAAICTFVGCGGRTVDLGSPQQAGTAGDGQSGGGEGGGTVQDGSTNQAGSTGQGGGVAGGTAVGGQAGNGGSTGGGGGAIGTGGSTVCGVIRASDYDQSCKTTLDCSLVFEGDTCTSPCACPNAPINSLAAKSYHPIFNHPNVCNCPMTPPPSCIAGVCTICPPTGCLTKDAGPDAPTCGVIKASDYDQTCTTELDCTTVVEGDTCTAAYCGCGTINKVAAESYHPIFKQTGICSCAGGPPPSCVGGICTICPSSECPPRDAGQDAPTCGLINAADYDRSCSVESDCTAVFSGDTCSKPCACPNATINKGALASYHPIVADNFVCGCSSVMPVCANGTCTVLIPIE